MSDEHASPPTMQAAPARRTRREGTRRPRLGGALVLAGLAANPWLLGLLFSADGSVDSVPTRALMLVFDGYLVLLGLYLRAGRPLARLPGLLAFVTLNLLITAEIGLRLAGQGPWDPPIVSVSVAPGGRFFQADPELGFAMLPGRFEVTLTKTGYRFDVTHDADGLRPTRPADAAPTTDAGAVWAVGCSYTHGWTLDDEDTWPWRLAASLPGREVRNLGVDGYGTLQQLILLRRTLAAADHPPAVVVLAYASFHDVRNTFVRLRRKDAAPANHLGPLVQPYARLAADGSLNLSMAEVVFREVPFMRVSAVVHALERAYNDMQDSRAASPIVSWLLINDMARTCAEAGARFVVAGMIDDERTVAMGQRCRDAGLLFVDASVDADDPAMSNMPHDPHPSAAAAARFAETIGAFLADEGLLEPPRR